MMGGWHGGSTTQYSLLAPQAEGGFAAAVALSPACRARLGDWNGVGGVYPNVSRGRGATTGGNAEAWADSICEVLAFFDPRLAPAVGSR